LVCRITVEYRCCCQDVARNQVVAEPSVDLDMRGVLQKLVALQDCDVALDRC
jgi:hypothetical protein